MHCITVSVPTDAFTLHNAFKYNYVLTSVEVHVLCFWFIHLLLPLTFLKLILIE